MLGSLAAGLAGKTQAGLQPDGGVSEAVPGASIQGRGGGVRGRLALSWWEGRPELWMRLWVWGAARQLCGWSPLAKE